MNKDQAIKAKAEWMAYCLEIGFPKSDLDELSNIWDRFKDENGNLRKTPKSLPGEGVEQADWKPKLRQLIDRLQSSSSGVTQYPIIEEFVEKLIAGASWDAGKKDAVEFSIWINQNYTLSDNPHFQQVWHKRGGLSEKKSTEELYNLFNSKNTLKGK